MSLPGRAHVQAEQHRQRQREKNFGRFITCGAFAEAVKLARSYSDSELVMALKKKERLDQIMRISAQISSPIMVFGETSPQTFLHPCTPTLFCALRLPLTEWVVQSELGGTHYPILH
eukprot:6200424-Pleurochrysis_carterae.AAC.2